MCAKRWQSFLLTIFIPQDNCTWLFMSYTVLQNYNITSTWTCINMIDVASKYVSIYVRLFKLFLEAKGKCCCSSVFILNTFNINLSYKEFSIDLHISSSMLVFLDPFYFDRFPLFKSLLFVYWVVETLKIIVALFSLQLPFWYGSWLSSHSALQVFHCVSTSIFLLSEYVYFTKV